MTRLLAVAVASALASPFDLAPFDVAQGRQASQPPIFRARTDLVRPARTSSASSTFTAQREAGFIVK
jgi:hypothetical protein